MGWTKLKEASPYQKKLLCAHVLGELKLRHVLSNQLSDAEKTTQLDTYENGRQDQFLEDSLIHSELSLDFF